MKRRGRALPALLGLVLAGLAPACDYDAAWRAWCKQNHCEDGPAGDGGVAYHCDGCTALGEVCVVLDGAAACRQGCTGFVGACGAGLDCKLAVSASQIEMVPACLPSGASVDLCGGSPVDCAPGYSCAKDFLETYRCLEQCTPFKTTCDSAAEQCAYGLRWFPADWGYCN